MNLKTFIPKHAKQIVAFLLFLFSLTLLALGFYKNQWHAAGKKWFLDWKRERDFWVVGRLVWSQQNGMLSDGALLGIGDGGWPPTIEQINYQYEVYERQDEFESFWNYTSAIGFQGILFHTFDQATGFDPAYNLKIFRGAAALLAAAVFASLVVWFFLEFGSLPALVALAFMMSSEWLALFSGSIYWQVWTFYLPILGLTYYLALKGKENIPKAPCWLIFGTVFIKGLLSGFEFFTTALVAIFVPVVYFAVLYRWEWNPLMRFALAVAGSALAGLLANLAILFIQIAAVKGGWSQAAQTLSYTLKKRTFFEAQSATANLGSPDVKAADILWKYVFGGRAINLGSIFKIKQPFLVSISEIKYFHIFLFFVFMSLLFLVLYKGYFSAPGRRNILALFIATWFSSLAPLSWLMIFKSHSSVHAQLNFIVWQIPFTLYGFALCGAILQCITIRTQGARKAAINK